MTPAARVQSAIEIIDLVIVAARDNGPPADKIIADWFRSRRFAGSSDRRAVRELAYGAIRKCGEIPQSGRAAMLTLANDDPSLGSLFDGSAHAPCRIAEGERYARPGIAPAWLEKLLTGSEVSEAEAAALLGRAPLDIRVNSLKAERDGLELPAQYEPTSAPHGLRLPFGTQVEQWPAYMAGLIEVQDTGSQLICEAVAARPKFAFFPFGAGHKKCIGEEFAWQEAAIIVAMVMRRWQLELLPDQDLRPFVGITLRTQPGAGVRVHLRQLAAG